MPIYEYECGDCNKKTEIMQKITDPPLSVCPDCNGPMQKIVSPAGLHFKGSGWYITDYAKKNGQPPTNSKGEKKPDTPAASEVPAKKENTSTPREKSKD
ncbi:MAG: FmdB family zinc ribbon protein [Nitrospiria bacterium]